MPDDEVCVLMDCLDTSGDWSRIEYDELERFAKGRGKLKMKSGHLNGMNNDASDDEALSLDENSDDATRRPTKRKGKRVKERKAISVRGLPCCAQPNSRYYMQ